MWRLVRKNWRKILLRGVLLLILLSVAFLFTKAAWRMYGRYEEASLGRYGAEADLRALEARRDTLIQDTEHLSSRRGLEEELRRRYGVALPDEGVIEMIDAPLPTSTAPSAAGKLKEWLNWLF